MSSQLPKSTPSKQGIDPEVVSQFIDSVQNHKGLELHSLMIMRHGYVVAEGWWEPYTKERGKSMFSLSKSFTSTAVGIAVDEGLISLSDPVLSYFEEESPEDPEGYWKELTIHHLLSMNTGHDEDTLIYMRESKNLEWTSEFFKHPLVHRPGTYFLYNTGATYILSAIIQKVTGKRVFDYLRPRLFEPLGICDAEWELSPQGYDYGGFGLIVKTEDILRFGKLYLQKGMWEGKRILPEGWAELAMSVHSDNRSTESLPDWTAGYGYQFWRCVPGFFRGDGAFGQFCIVIPEKDTVIAITSGCTDMQAVLTHIWEELLPGIKDSAKINEKADKKLAEKLSSAKYLPLSIKKDSPIEKEISGHTYYMDENIQNVQSVRFDFDEDTLSAHFNMGKECVKMECGREKWINSCYTANAEYNVTPRSGFETAASFTWESERRLKITARDLGSAFVMNWDIYFTETGLQYKHNVNVTFGPSSYPAVIGSRK